MTKRRKTLLTLLVPLLLALLGLIVVAGGALGSAELGIVFVILLAWLISFAWPGKRET